MSEGALQRKAPRLEVLGKLASGGMGTVSVARMAGEPDGIVAVKRMHAHLGRDGEFLRMFLNEIWLTGALDHPNVVRLIAWGVDDEGPFFATEFVHGVSLGEMAYYGRQHRDPLPHPLAAHVGARVAAGLHAAHELVGDEGRSLGIVHRDVSPTNVLVGFDGAVKVTDFGIAKAALRSGDFTRTGFVKGKVSYMSPEQARGAPLDPRSDLYALGVVLFEMMTGERPFSAASEIELLKRVALGGAPSLAAAQDGARPIDPALGRIVDRLLATEPADRWQTGAELGAALDAWLAAHTGGPDATERELAAYATRYGTARRERLAEILSAGHERLPATSARIGRVDADATPSGAPSEMVFRMDSEPPAESAARPATREVVAEAPPLRIPPPMPAPSAARPRAEELALDPAPAPRPASEHDGAIADAVALALASQGPPLARGDAPHVARGATRRGRWITVGVGALAGALATAAVSLGRAPPAVVSAGAALFAVALAERAVAGAPPPEADVPEADDDVPLAASAAPHGTAPLPPPPSRPRRPCTPADFDYPHCRR
jgi:serine/threonine-protein kinase